MTDPKTPPTGTDALQGPDHPAWKGDRANTTTKRERAIRRYMLGSCDLCGKPATERHHKDADTGNNAKSNVQLLCRRCHMTVDGRLAKFADNQARNAEAQRKPPRECRVCGRIASPKRMWADRCHRCHEYWRRHGSDRPWGNRNATTAGELNGRARLTVEQVREIRASSDSLRVLASRFGVGKTTVAEIRSGKKWKAV